MAIFGAPLPLDRHAEAAALAALDMIEMIELLAVERRSAGRVPIRIGIGIGTGNLVAGYTGTQQRATYTCIGDTVNVAARLEQHTKAVARVILVDAATRAELSADFSVEPLGAVELRGKSAPVEVFALERSA
jgi:class 3 adenylate cyclase